MTLKQKLKENKTEFTYFVLTTISSCLAWGVVGLTLTLVFYPNNLALQLSVCVISILISGLIYYKKPHWLIPAKPIKENRLKVLEKEFEKSNESLDLLYHWIQMNQINVEEFSYLLDKKGQKK